MINLLQLLAFPSVQVLHEASQALQEDAGLVLRLLLSIK